MKFVRGVGLFVFLSVRGLVLWILVPFAAVAWVLMHSWVQRASIGQAICWYDQVFGAALLAGPLRWALPHGGRVSLAEIPSMNTVRPYKISLTHDFA